MRPEERTLDTAFRFLDEAHRSLVADATRVFSITEEHSDTDYSSSLHTYDLEASDKYVEERITDHWQDMNKSMKRMDAALTEIDEKLHETQSKAIKTGEYIDLVEKKRWYGEKYNQLMDELSEIQETSLVDKKREHSRTEYERPQDDFSIEKGEMPERKKAERLVK